MPLPDPKWAGRGKMAKLRQATLSEHNALHQLIMPWAWPPTSSESEDLNGGNVSSEARARCLQDISGVTSHSLPGALATNFALPFLQVYLHDFLWMYPRLFGSVWPAQFNLLQQCKKKKKNIELSGSHIGTFYCVSLLTTNIDLTSAPVMVQLQGHRKKTDISCPLKPHLSQTPKRVPLYFEPKFSHGLSQRNNFMPLPFFLGNLIIFTMNLIFRIFRGSFKQLFLIVLGLPSFANDHNITDQQLPCLGAGLYRARNKFVRVLTVILRACPDVQDTYHIDGYTECSIL